MNVEARSAIQDCVYRYARSVDRRDWTGVQSCYHDDAVDNHGGYIGGRDGLIEWMKSRHQTIVLSLHFVSNVLIDFFGADRARVESYCTTVQRTKVRDAVESLRMYAIEGLDDASPDDLVETSVRCRFVDVITNRNEDWRIERRIVVFETLDYRVLTEAAFGEAFARGSRTATDHLWTIES